MIHSKGVYRLAGVAAVLSWLLLSSCDDSSQSVSVGGTVSGLATGNTVMLANNGGNDSITLTLL
jgi:hypothetical protein